MLAPAIIDRVTFNAHILETRTAPYRLRTSKTSARRAVAATLGRLWVGGG